MQKIKQEDMHQSMRGYFSGYLFNEMIDNKKIWLVTADLGYGVFDKIRDSFPERFLNTGAAEFAAAGICVGLAMEGYIPVFYSITTFGLYRPFEVWRNYVNKEKWPVKMAFSGRNKDYAHDGFSHDSSDAVKLFYPFTIFDNIKALWPKEKEEIPDLMNEFLYNKSPYFLSLKR